MKLQVNGSEKLRSEYSYNPLAPRGIDLVDVDNNSFFEFFREILDLLDETGEEAGIPPQILEQFAIPVL